MRTAFVSILCAPLVALAQAPTLDFKGIPFGANQEALRQISLEVRAYDCAPTKPEETLCSIGGMTFANVSTNLVLVTFFRDSMEHVFIQGPSAAFDVTLHALTEKYGKPSWQERKAVRTKIGVPYEQAKYLWRTKDGGTIMASRFHEDVETSSYSMSSRAATERQERESAAQPKAKKDI